MAGEDVGACEEPEGSAEGFRVVDNGRVDAVTRPSALGAADAATRAELADVGGDGVGGLHAWRPRKVAPTAIWSTRRNRRPTLAPTPVNQFMPERRAAKSAAMALSRRCQSAAANVAVRCPASR